ncbi:MAG: class I SAM-dependent methyltransferase [Myxococcota bacterium]
MRPAPSTRSALVLVLLLLGAPGVAAAQEATISPGIRAAQDAPHRTAEERARDANRKPVETLAFFGLRDDMRVLEIVPGGAWYTKLLAPALRERGELYVWLGFERFADRLSQPGLDGVRVAAREVRLEATDRRGIFALEPFSFGLSGLDAVLTFRNLHNLTPAARASLHRAVFEALRPGGVYGVVDHTRRHMEPDGPENRRRLDPVVAIQEALAAGFVLDGWSDLHYRPDDELRYEVGRRSVTGNTDRFTLRFRRPE